MRIISVHSIAGGTGVTSVATEIIADKLRADHAVLAIDLGGNQMLGRMNRGRGFETVGHADLFFEDLVTTRLLIGDSLPHRSLLDLRGRRYPHDRCSEEIISAAFTSEDAVADKLQQHLDQFAGQFDTCVVDLSQAPHILRKVFAEISDEVHFCERLTMESQSWNAFHDAYLKGGTRKPEQLWIKHPDRGEWRPNVIEDSPGMLLVNA